MVAQPVAYSIREDAKANTFSATPLDASVAIQSLQPSPQSHHAQVFIAQQHVVAHAFYSTGGTHGVNQHPEVSPAVKVGSGLGIPSPPAVAFTAGNLARGAGASPNADVSQTLQSQHGRGSTDQQPCVAHAMTVRRLTPRECERLQGFPDDYTSIPWRGKAETPDGPRYKALGNSMAVNCMEWIGERIAAQEAR
jgi:site-specific DNA-cytosine methylase